MKKVVSLIVLVSMISLLCGCECFFKNARQTAKNTNAVALDGNAQDLYADK